MTEEQCYQCKHVGYIYCEIFGGYPPQDLCKEFEQRFETEMEYKWFIDFFKRHQATEMGRILDELGEIYVQKVREEKDGKS